jgi:hypothetical protein
MTTKHSGSNPIIGEDADHRESREAFHFLAIAFNFVNTHQSAHE